MTELASLQRPFGDRFDALVRDAQNLVSDYQKLGNPSESHDARWRQIGGFLSGHRKVDFQTLDDVAPQCLGLIVTLLVQEQPVKVPPSVMLGLVELAIESLDRLSKDRQGENLYGTDGLQLIGHMKNVFPRAIIHALANSNNDPEVLSRAAQVSRDFETRAEPRFAVP